MDLIKLCKDNSTTILTGLGVLGVVSTAVMTAKATPKALDILAEKEEYKQKEYGESLTFFEKALAVTPAYLPAVIMGTATIASILGANHISNVKQANLIAAYTCLDASYKEYKNKVKDVFGEKAAERVDKELEKERYLCETYGDPTETKLFYDEFSGRYFEKNIYEMLKATYDINKIYGLLGELSLNQVYEFFDLAPIETGDTIGWNAAKDWECYGFAWLDISWEPIDTPDGLEAYGICFNIGPAKDFQEW